MRTYHKMLKSIIDVAEAIDDKFGWIEKYDYETQPYCGHHHEGHEGKLTESHYHEGMGGRHIKGFIRITDSTGMKPRMFIPAYYSMKRKLRNMFVNVNYSDENRALLICWQTWNKNFHYKLIQLKPKRR